jgi:predicted dehydrogenase
MTESGLRWGILGTGGIAAAFATDLAHLRSHRLVAVGSRTVAGAQAFGARFDVPHRHGSTDDLVTDAEVDAVYVATPHPAHAAGALAAIAAGKHVLVETPFTMGAAQARAIADAARAAGVVALEAMWTRFLPHVLRIRDLLRQNAIGEIRTVAADHGQRFAPDPAHRLYDPALGGGALLDLGIYPVSWASMVLGPPSSVHATSDPAMTGVDAQTSIVLRYPGGAHALLTSTLQSFTPCRAWIAGTEGSIEVDPVFYAPTSFTLRRKDGHLEPFLAATSQLDASQLDASQLVTSQLVTSQLVTDGRGPAVRFETAAEAMPIRDEGRADGKWGKGLRFEAAELARCVAEGLPESPQLPLAETVSIMETMDEVRRQIGLTFPGSSA